MFCHTDEWLSNFSNMFFFCWSCYCSRSLMSYRCCCTCSDKNNVRTLFGRVYQLIFSFANNEFRFAEETDGKFNFPEDTTANNYEFCTQSTTKKKRTAWAIRPIQIVHIISQRYTFDCSETIYGWVWLVFFFRSFQLFNTM